MKEIIYNIDGVAGRVITLTGLTGTFTKNNVLGIINKSQGDVLYTPMDWNLLTFAYSNGTMTLTLAESVAAIVAGDKLFIKLYTDDAAGGYDEMVAEFFGVTLLQGYEFMTESEVTDELEDIMGSLDTDLTETVEYPAGSGTYMTKAQAITAQAMQIINPSES
jgi:hypothetical protein